MATKSDHGDHSTCPRSSISQARFQRKPWDEKMTLVLIADETSWPACLFVLDLLMKQIIKLEKQEDHDIMTSKASPIMRIFKADKDDFRYHDYFDLVCGTSTGGLIAIMLGHLRLSLQETSTRMTEVLQFPRASPLRQLFTNARSKDSRQIHARLHDKMELEVLKPSLLSCNSHRRVCQSNASQFVSVPGMCQTLVLAARKGTSSKYHAFRSYKKPENMGGRSPRPEEKQVSVSVVNVCRAAIANPSHHESVDTQLVSQNSVARMTGATTKDIDFTSLIEDELDYLHHGKASLRCLVELGGQSERQPSIWRSCLPFGKAPSDGHEYEPKINASSGNHQHFQLKDLHELASHVTSSVTEAEKYCSDKGLYRIVESCARVLVKARRSRADTANWEIFAFSDRYSCSICRTEGGDSGILDKPAFFDHVEYTHDFYELSPPDMIKVQNESKLKL
ncbi:hypothetical protein D6C79_10091 [Aureobasidium pullulans]|nr:hypothetical protein D6C79_10091 [Aureobasidium pullulans]